MSDAVLVGLITGGVGVAGLALNVWSQTQERKQRQIERAADNREWYSRTLFDRRIASLSAEYSWLMKLNKLRAEADQNLPDAAQQLNRASDDARAWYSSNAILLYEATPKSSDFIGVLNSIGASDFHSQLNDALKSHRRRVDSFMAQGRDV